MRVHFRIVPIAVALSTSVVLWIGTDDACGQAAVAQDVAESTSDAADSAVPGVIEEDVLEEDEFREREARQQDATEPDAGQPAPTPPNRPNPQPTLPEPTKPTEPAVPRPTPPQPTEPRTTPPSSPTPPPSAPPEEIQLDELKARIQRLEEQIQSLQGSREVPQDVEQRLEALEGRIGQQPAAPAGGVGQPAAGNAAGHSRQHPSAVQACPRPVVPAAWCGCAPPGIVPGITVRTIGGESRRVEFARRADAGGYRIVRVAPGSSKTDSEAPASDVGESPSEEQQLPVPDADATDVPDVSPEPSPEVDAEPTANGGTSAFRSENSETPLPDPIDVSQLSPRDAGRLYTVGYNLYWNGAFAEAYRHFAAAVPLRPDDARLLYYRGLAEAALDWHADADHSLRQAAQLEQTTHMGSRAVSRALERLQGQQRMWLESYRRQARLEVAAN